MGRPRSLLSLTPRQYAPLVALILAAAGLAALLLGRGGPPAAAAPPAEGGPPAAGATPPAELVSTFSIVAFDPDTGDLGVAVQSKFFAVGRVVPFAAAGVGAVATQSYANTTYGPRGLELLERGRSPDEVIRVLTGDDAQRELRQVGVVDAAGNVATFTGEANLPWAGGRTGAHYTVQGNILAGQEVVDAMAAAFEQGEGALATRLVDALAAGQRAGGDARGRQSAALLVVREGGGYGGFDDRYIELRVEDDAAPIAELQRLLDIRHGQLAHDRARALLGEMAAANEADRDVLLADALEAATAATVLFPADGWAWLTLAELNLLGGDLDSAAVAGRQALQRDPWIKTAILEGFRGSTRVIEALRQDPAFRTAWERIEVR